MFAPPRCFVSRAAQHTSPPRRALFARQVFDQFTRQDTVFKVAARDIVRGALKGFNGTIFAYGQTGSGKTYTITGGAQYKERGFIPRTISTVFSGIKKAPEGTSYKVKLSYIEIYNENIYDLLDRYVPGEEPLAHWTISLHCLPQRACVATPGRLEEGAHV